MTRTLTFGPCKDATNQPSTCCQRFTLLVTRFLMGGNLLNYNPQSGQGTRPRDVQKMEARIVRAYKGISDEVPDLAGVRTLKTDGGTMTLEQPDFLLLEKYVQAAPGNTQDADVIDDLIDWVSAAPKEGD